MASLLPGETMSHLLDPPDHRAAPNSHAALLPLKLAFAEIGVRVHPATFHRWHVRGLRGIKLKAKRIGGRWYVTRQAVLDFIRDRSYQEEQAPKNHRPSDNTRQERIEAALQAMGL